MPTYQYACTACSERLEAVQSFTDAPLTECPACGGALRKVFSAVGVVFKGSGFYKTDSRTSSGGDKKPAGDKGGDKGGDKAAASTSSEGSSSSSTSTGSGASSAPAAPSTSSSTSAASKTA